MVSELLPVNMTHDVLQLFPSRQSLVYAPPRGSNSFCIFRHVAVASHAQKLESTTKKLEALPWRTTHSLVALGFTAEFCAGGTLHPSSRRDSVMRTMSRRGSKHSRTCSKSYVMQKKGVPRKSRAQSLMCYSTTRMDGWTTDAHQFRFF